jgi:hypothetical protein
MERLRRGSYFIWERSALVLLFMPLRVPTADSSYSILILNHDWQPDRRYDLWDSWVGKIVDIRGNSPRNVRLSRPCTDIRAHWPSSKDLGCREMVLLREGHCGTGTKEEWQTSNVRINSISGPLSRETSGSGTHHPTASLSVAPPKITK